jgi:hypothetical protein
MLDAELLAAVYVERTTSSCRAAWCVNAHRAFVQRLGSEAIWRDYVTLRECTRAA